MLIGVAMAIAGELVLCLAMHGEETITGKAVVSI